MYFQGTTLIFQTLCFPVEKKVFLNRLQQLYKELNTMIDSSLGTTYYACRVSCLPLFASKLPYQRFQMYF